MGFSALLLLHSGTSICCGAFEHCCSTFGSPLFGSRRALQLRQPAARVYAVNIVRKKIIAVAAVRNDFSGEEKREEEKKKQLLGVASASIGFNAVLLMSVTTKPALPVSHKDASYSWLSLPLLTVWGAILLNAFVQYRILERLTCLPQRRESKGRVDSTLQHRVAELEEDVREFVTTARGLSKQVEKLGVRFRATKRTLRDPMQETAAFAQKTSEVTAILAQREERLEEELRGLQRALLAMQEHQVKQLALISVALKRTQNNEGGRGTTKKLGVNGNGSGTKTSADTNARGGLRGGAVRVVETPKPVETPKIVEMGANNGRGDSASQSSTFSSEGSLSKVDFWKDSVTSSAVVEKMTVGSPASSDPRDGSDKSKLGSFFNGRKRATSPPENNFKSDSEVLPEPEDAQSYVEQPDYDSDSWLR